MWGRAMAQDFSEITFNSNQKQESAAREVAIGLRYVIASIVLNVFAIACMLAATATEVDGVSLFSLPATILAVCAVACGAYGIYSMMDGLGWSGAFSIVVIAMLFIPFAKLLVLIVVGALALNLIHRSGFHFSLFGALKKKDTSAASA
jgi:chromate transport protein ChrA